MSVVNMSNVEALANGEAGGTKTCYNTITSKEGSQVRYCATCTFIDGAASWVSGSSTC